MNAVLCSQQATPPGKTARDRDHSAAPPVPPPYLCGCIVSFHDGWDALGRDDDSCSAYRGRCSAFPMKESLVTARS